MRLGVTKSLGFWVLISMVGVITLGVLLSIKHWDWLQGGTENTDNADTVRNVALVVGGVVAILTALWRSIVAETQATAATQQSQTGEPGVPEREISAGGEHVGGQCAPGPFGRDIRPRTPG